MPKLTSEEYVNEGGVRCPACQNHDIEGGSVEIEQGCAFQGCHCLTCGAEWTDVYELKRYDYLESGHVKVAHGQCDICGHFGDDCTGVSA